MILGASPPRHRLRVALVMLAVGIVVVSGCGANDDGGVITPAKTATSAPPSRPGPN